MFHAGDQIENPVTGERFTFIETAASSDGERLAFELALRPGGAVPLAHVHPIQTETFTVTHGRMRFRLGSEQVVAEGDGLGGLQVGEAGHRVRGVLRGAGGEGSHDVGDLGVEPVDGVADPKAEVGGDLVVATARGVQALAGLADRLRQPRLYVHVDVFEGLVPGEVPGLDPRPSSPPA